MGFFLLQELVVVSLDEWVPDEEGDDHLDDRNYRASPGNRSNVATQADWRWPRLLHDSLWQKANCKGSISGHGADHWGTDKWYEQVNVINDWQTEQQWLVDVEDGRNQFNLTNFLQLSWLSSRAYGNAKELAKVLKKYFNIPINAYVLINMGGLQTIINKVGGVDITPNLSFTYEGYTFTKGEKTHMDGAKALAYSRMRYDDPEGDYGRQKRQRQILAALMKKAESATTLLNTSFISSLSKQVQTDMTSLAKNYLAATKNLESDYTHGTGYMEDGVSYQNISTAERQRIINLIRKAMGLKTKKVS